jgi:hypothetical protein
MLAGQGIVAIWNDISEDGRDEFYAWHIREHMPERVGSPGFRRGRRYRACDDVTRPEFFTLYETESFEVLQGQDYANRLNAPTEWTRRATAHFENTSRALARVWASHGAGPGGSLLTLRFDVPDARADHVRRELTAKLLEIARLSEITGAHLCRADDAASGIRTSESKDRTDILAPPRWIALVEACTAKALALPEAMLKAHAFVADAAAGRYTMEHTRLKTDWAAG